MKTILGYVIILALSLSFSGCGEEAPITFLNYPNDIEERIDTIEVSYITWACACANWINNEYFEKNPDYIDKDYAKDCFFIEAENEDDMLPEKYHSNRYDIRLIGSFYKDNGISKDYIKPTSQKPEKSRVFRYVKYEIIGRRK